MKTSLIILSGVLIALLSGCGGSSVPSQNENNTNKNAVESVKVNSTPVATFDTFTISRDTRYDGQLTATDSDGDMLKYIIVTQPKHGSVKLNANGCFIYTSDKDYVGKDTFSYKASDDVSACAVKTVTVNVKAPTTSAPTAPSNLQVKALSTTKLELTWQDNADNEEGFAIYQDGKLVATTKANQTQKVLCCGLEAGKTYNFEVKAKNEAGLSSPASAKGTTKDVTTPPQAPTNLKAKAIGKTSLRLVWHDNADNESGYEIYQDGKLVKTISSDCQCAVITGLKEATEYKFLLKAANKIGKSSSNALSVKTKGGTNRSLKYHITNNGVVLDSFMVKNQNVLSDNSTIFDLKILNLIDNKIYGIDSLSNWNSVVKDGQNIIFSSPKDSKLPKTLKVIATIKQENKQASFDVEIDGVGSKHSIVDIEIPKLNIKKLPSGNFLIPKYTGKVVKTDEVAIKRDMLYPCGWCSTMQFLAYYNDKVGVYIGNHDPKSSTKRFVINDHGNYISYDTNITVPNRGLSNNNFKLSGEFVLAPLNGDWYDAALQYKSWASKNALYWPKMDDRRIKSQHNIGDIALWVTSTYISAITDSNRTQASKDEHIKNYLTNIKNIIGDFVATQYPDIKVGIFWHEWYGKLHDTNFPSVFFPDNSKLTNIKAMMDDVKTKYPNIVFMPYINGLLYNTSLPEFNQEFMKYALKDVTGNIVHYYPHGEGKDQNRPEYIYARMDPTATPWQNKVKDASDIVLNKLDANGINIDQVTASRPIEDMDKTHNHPIAGGSWWRDGYDSMFSKIEKSANDKKFITSEGANEFLSNRIDGFFVHWDGTSHMVPAYQVVYGGRVQLFGLEMRTNTYGKDLYFMLRGQAFVNGFGIGMITSFLSKDSSAVAKVAYAYIKDISWMKYNLREFLSYGTRQRDLKLSGNIGLISDVTGPEKQFHGLSDEEDNNDGITITMPAIQHSVYKSEDGKKIAFIFTNVSRKDSTNFSFDINGAVYGLEGDLKLTVVTPNKIESPKTKANLFTQNVALEPLHSIAFIIQK